MFKEELKNVLNNTVARFKVSNDTKEKKKLFNDMMMYRKLLNYVEENEENISSSLHMQCTVMRMPEPDSVSEALYSCDGE